MSEPTAPEPSIPFQGKLMFDLTFVLLGKAAVRRLRVDYRYRPDWDYFDTDAGGVISGGPEETQTVLWLQVAPEEAEISYFADIHGHRIETEKLLDQKSKPHTWQDWDEPRWVRADTLNELQVLPFEMWDLIDAAIDKKCRVEDEQRRTKHMDAPPRNPRRKRTKRRR
jgi:hypothetical protein